MVQAGLEHAGNLAIALSPVAPGQMPIGDGGDEWELTCPQAGPDERASDREGQANAIVTVGAIDNRQDTTPKGYGVLGGE